MGRQRYNQKAPAYVPTVLETYMRRRGIKQVHLVAIAGVYQSRISEALSGKTNRQLPPDAMERIARHLGIVNKDFLLRPYDAAEDARGTYTGVGVMGR